MDLKKEGLVIGVVGPSGGGKSTLVDKLELDLNSRGFKVRQTNVGDYYRDKASGENKPLEEILLRDGRKHLDTEIDGHVIDLMLSAIGIAAWRNKNPDVPMSLVIVSGRVVSLIGSGLIEMGMIPADSFYGIGVTCSRVEIARRAMLKNRRLGKYSEDQAHLSDRKLQAIESQKILGRDRGDLSAYHDLYGVHSLTELSSRKYNMMKVSTTNRSVEQELARVIKGLTNFGLLATA